MLVNEGKQNIDDNMKEQQEEAKKAEEEKERSKSRLMKPRRNVRKRKSFLK